jgi:NAD(P)H-hydrate epimerase
MSSATALLTCAEMAQADALTVESGTPSLALMEAAGMAVAREIRRNYPRQPVVVLCGPGNNGGDGYVAARHLQKAGWPVKVYSACPVSDLTGDAAVMAQRWLRLKHPVRGLCSEAFRDEPLVVDALFGAGLDRPLEATVSDVLQTVHHNGLTVVAVDVPSGMDADAGTVDASTLACDMTISFFRPKVGHFLMPAAAYVGRLVIVDIGISEDVLDDILPGAYLNGTGMWSIPVPTWQDHKYTRGHGLILGGARMTGAAVLAARAARRIGIGLMTIAAPTGTSLHYASDRPGAIVSELVDWEDWEAHVDDPKKTAYLIGPGAGVSRSTANFVLAALATQKPCVLDADALTAFENAPDQLFSNIHGACVLTPHDGEFARIFPAETGNRLERALAAAEKSNAVIVLKGYDTVIACPEGRAVINGSGVPYLATAGAGDVLAGLILGLLGQGLSAFDAACAAVWLHGYAAGKLGAGLIAEDLPEIMPEILRELTQGVPEN